MTNEELPDLIKEKQELQSYLKDLIQIYKLDSSLFTPDIWFDLINLEKDHKNNDSMWGVMELRSKLRAKHAPQADKLLKLKSKIQTQTIDSVLEKIKLIDKGLDGS